MEIIMSVNAKIKECQYCKQPYFAKRRDAKYCSHACRQFAFVARKAFLHHTTTPLEKQTPADKNVAKRKEGIIKRFLKLLW